MKHPIIPLPQEQWQDAVLPIGYTTTEYYDVSLEQNADGFSLSIQKKPLEEPITRTPQGHDFPDRLFAAHWQGARAWGIVEDGKLLGAIELCAEEVEPTACHRALGGPVAAKARLRARADGDCQTAGAACPPPSADFGDPVGKRQCHRILPA